MLYRNWPLKIAAAGLAIFLWFWVTVGERGVGQPGDFRIRASGISMISARTVPVILQTKGSLPPNLAVASTQLDPPMVTVVGSSLRIGEVTCIRTEELDLGQVSHSLDKELRLIVPSGVQVPNTTSVRITLAITGQRVAQGPAPRPTETAIR